MASNTSQAIEKRRQQAEIAKQIFDELALELGAVKASEILQRAITKASVIEGACCAENANGDISPRSFFKLMMSWAEDGTLEIEPINVTPDQVHFRITRCRYAEMYRDADMTDLGKILSCGRDGTICSGFNPKIRLERTKTIMDGDKYCNFLLRLMD